MLAFVGEGKNAFNLNHTNSQKKKNLNHAKDDKKKNLNHAKLAAMEKEAS